ncbi:hypothetical protein [Acinetobacter radioresistens]|uniref:hypothetical protein n=1 Tax=Acinetobacter radioresistens TaxID=40216 RepID=UPI001D18CEB9|nr:hypothetical protein [Acinetobacter radioresistens]
MDISTKQEKWRQERPLFEAEFIHSHLLQFFNFNENTGDYEIKSEFSEDEDKELAFEVLNTGWAMWLRAKRNVKAQAVPEGFVLMPRQCTNSMARAAKEIDGRLSAFKYGDVYQAMIEAQEQDHA